MGMPLHVEHIVPLAAGGETIETNLWLACPLCNGHKATRTYFPDPLDGVETRLFNPRQQLWSEHFRWSDDGLEIIGLTAVGRATVEALRLNNEHLRRARRRWLMAGWQAPTSTTDSD